MNEQSPSDHPTLPPAVPTAADATHGGISRRRMLSGAAALAGASLLGAGQAAAAAAETASEADPKADVRPHLKFSLAGKGVRVTGAARGIGRAICGMGLLRTAVPTVVRLPPHAGPARTNAAR